MKKIIICILMLLCIGCSSKTEYKIIERDEFPQAIMGTLPNGLDITEAEDIISSTCILKGWNITSRTEGWMVVYRAVDAYDLYGSITYNENNYTISMDNIKSPAQVEYDHWRVSKDQYVIEKQRFKLFNKYASNLSRSIQKAGIKFAARSQKYEVKRRRQEANPIIINNNVGR